jgi:predicted Fe-S protein YdhL (DUF1289 family)
VVHGRIVTDGWGVCVGRGRNISEIIFWDYYPATIQAIR